MTSSSPRAYPGPDLRGVVLGDRYRLVELIACGGMASVHVALDLRLRRPVAVKVLFPEHTRSEEQRRRILQEAVLGARVDHPHVMPVLDAGEEAGASLGELDDDGGRLYIVMPLVEGPSLRSVLLDGVVGWRRAALLVGQLLAGLAAIHRAGALHRDVKPENCLVGQVDGREHLRLADLGLAKALGVGFTSRPPASVDGALVGTLAYLSPEQVQGRPLDERADLYAAGVVLFELLTRRTPFVGGHFELLCAHVHTPPPSPRVVAPGAGIPEAVAEVCLRALEKEPSRRFGSAEAFAEALADAVAAADGVDGGTRPCRPEHAGADAATASLAAWTRFEYRRACDEAGRAARVNPAWAPLRLLMLCLPEGDR